MIDFSGVTPPKDFVVFYANSTVEVKSYGAYHHAQAFAVKKNADEVKRYGKWAKFVVVYEREFYEKYVVHREMRKHRLTGEMFETWSNTPYYLCPSSETYHSR